MSKSACLTPIARSGLEVVGGLCRGGTEGGGLSDSSAGGRRQDFIGRTSFSLVCKIGLGSRGSDLQVLEGQTYTIDSQSVEG